MQALAKRVSARSGATPSSTAIGSPSMPNTLRGPRNQPKRKGRK
jgi:hypothetical protein